MLNRILIIQNTFTFGTLLRGNATYNIVKDFKRFKKSPWKIKLRDWRGSLHIIHQLLPRHQMLAEPTSNKQLDRDQVPTFAISISFQNKISGFIATSLIKLCGNRSTDPITFSAKNSRPQNSPEAVSVLCAGFVHSSLQIRPSGLG